MAWSRRLVRWLPPVRQLQLIPIVGPLDMRDQFAIASDLFEHQEVKPNCLNPCCSRRTTDRRGARATVKG
jgi:hypothetical protein